MKKGKKATLLAVIIASVVFIFEVLPNISNDTVADITPSDVYTESVFTEEYSESEKTDETTKAREKFTTYSEYRSSFTYSSEPEYSYRFRNKKRLDEHFEKHGREVGASSAAEYEKKASAVVENPKALHKIEAEDGDDVYFIKSTGEFVIVSTDGYLRTYYIADYDYFKRQ